MIEFHGVEEGLELDGFVVVIKRDHHDARAHPIIPHRLAIKVGGEVVLKAILIDDGACHGITTTITQFRKFF